MFLRIYWTNLFELPFRRRKKKRLGTGLGTMAESVDLVARNLGIIN